MNIKARICDVVIRNLIINYGRCDKFIITILSNRKIHKENNIIFWGTYITIATGDDNLSNKIKSIFDIKKNSVLHIKNNETYQVCLLKFYKKNKLNIFVFEETTDCRSF